MICPNCQNEQSVTEQNYGALYTCKSCQAVYFLNFEGQPLFDDQIEAIDTTPVTDHIFPDSLPTENSDPAAHDQLFEAPADSLGSFSAAAKDILDYGNTETQIAHLNYDLFMKGLDTAEMMALLKESIDDSRFGWDAVEIMRTVKQGEIQFLKLNPVKAYILAKRLQFLDVEKIWKQNAVG